MGVGMSSKFQFYSRETVTVLKDERIDMGWVAKVG